MADGLVPLSPASLRKCWLKGSVADSETNTNSEMSDVYNFVTLPEVAWVQIMQYLSLKDRYNLLLTCKALHEHFHHPSLWSHASFKFQGGSTNFEIGSTFVPEKVICMVEKFGHLFQNLSIHILGHLHSFSNDSRQLLIKLSEVCRLESLTLEAGKLTSFYDTRGFAPFKSDLMIFLSFVRNAYRLKQLRILSWPMFPKLFEREDCNILLAVSENKKLINLESLSLFWRIDSSWSEREPLLPSPAFVRSIIVPLKNLTHLALRSPMLSCDLLTTLSESNRAKLKLLQIHVTYSAYKEEYQIPDISSDVWKALVKSCPVLQVECSVMSHVPNSELSLLLNPEMPLSSITFFQFSKCNGQLIGSISDKFRASLQDFICYADITHVDVELRYLVSKCPKLKKLVFHGQIKCSTVVALATMTKGKWSVLEFVEKHVDTIEDNETDTDDEENEVIKRNAAGEYILVGLNKFHRSDEGRNEKIQQMISVVSGVLGHGWKLV